MRGGDDTYTCALLWCGCGVPVVDVCTSMFDYDLIQLPASTATAAEAVAGVVVATASETQAAQRVGSAVGAFDGNM